MNKYWVETIIGTIVLVVALFFFSFAYKLSGNINSNDAYVLKARFSNIDGIVIGSDVKISGIKLGRVHNLEIDLDSYEAIIYISISNHYKIPDDSTLAITSSGLLGGKYLDILPGMSEEYLAVDSEFLYTKASVSFESLITKFADKGGSKN